MKHDKPRKRVDWGLIWELVTDGVVLVALGCALWWGLVVLWAMRGGL